MRTRRIPKPVLVALKIDADTAQALEGIPNKSAFIREALRARLDDVCPLCSGTGRRPGTTPVAPGRRHLHALPSARCGDCGRESAVIQDVAARERTDLLREVDRLRTFLSYGDYYCPPCYERTRECARCGHRVPGRSPARESHACAR